MKCINKPVALHRKIVAGLLSCIMILLCCGCGSENYLIPYGSLDSTILSSTSNEASPQLADSFASNLCVISSETTQSFLTDFSDCESAVLFDVNNCNVVYSKNAFERLYPASLTKIMTALVAIKYGQPDMVLTATNSVNINESGAQLAGIVSGDSMTLYQALRIMMLYSANDVALLIAENIGGSVDNFVKMMNDEAVFLGATGTHFVNPNGLTDSDHYSTAYDLYLIFNECIKYQDFVDIISMSEYETSYTHNGSDKSISVKNTNGYISGSYSAPANISVVGGKTGTTSAAGHCLIILSKDINGSPYISVVLKSESTDSLYDNMNSLLNDIEQ